MNSHSEKQTAILKTMGVEVWKLRHPTNVLEVTASSRQRSEAVTSNVDVSDQSAVFSVATHNTTTAIKEQTSNFENEEAVKHNHDSFDAAVQSPKSDVEKSNFDANAGTEAVDWLATVSRRTGAKWCFVYALSDDHAIAETNLFEAIRFALGLSQSDCHVIEAIAVSQACSEADAERGIKNSLSALIEEERPANIMVLGEELAQFLIETDKPLDVLRSESYRYQGGASGLYVTYGLKHLLAHPLDKRFVWQDLVKARKAISG